MGDSIHDSRKPADQAHPKTGDSQPVRDTDASETKTSGLKENKQQLSDQQNALSAEARQQEATTQGNLPPLELVDGADSKIKLITPVSTDEELIPVDNVTVTAIRKVSVSEMDKAVYDRLSPKVDFLIRALTPHNGYDTQTNKEAVFSVLKDMSETDRQMVGLLYEQKRNQVDVDGDHGITADLKIAGITRGDRDRLTSLLRYGKDDDASRIHADLVDMSQMVTGPDVSSSERDIRDTLATLNSRDIQKLKKEYDSRYGVDLEEALRTDTHISAGTKTFLNIALRGSDKRTDADRAKIADVAIKNKDIQLFKEAMRGSSEEFRNKFLANDGQEKLKSFQGKDYDQAKEFAEQGTISTASTIRDNTWLDETAAFGIPSGIVDWIGLGNNKQAIEAKLSNLTSTERELYQEGRRLDLGLPKPEGDKRQFESSSALKFYEQVHTALTKAGNNVDIERWENIIAGKSTSDYPSAAAPVEDLLHNFILGGTGPARDHVEHIVNGLSPEQREKLKSDYHSKYGSDLIGDLSLNQESMANKGLVSLLGRQPTNDREEFHRQQDRMLSSYDGIGKSITNAFSATGRQADNAYQEYAESIAQSSKISQSIPPEERLRFTNNCSASLKSFTEAKKATAQGLADVAITTGALALTIPSGGTSLSLLGFTAGAAATAKVSIKTAIEGNDYDRSKLATDAISAGIDGATTAIAPQHIAKVMSLGARSAVKVAESTIAHVPAEAIKAGGEQLLKKDLNTLISHAIGNGSMKITDGQLSVLAKTIAVEGSEEQVETALKANLQSGIEMVCKSDLTKTMTRYGLHAGAGFAGSSLSGAYTAAAEVDPRAGIVDKASYITKSALASGTIGAVTGLSFSAGADAVGRALNKFGKANRVFTELTIAPEKTQTILDSDGKELFTSAHKLKAEVVQSAIDNGISLKGANLAGHDLSGVNWNNADLSGVNFQGANLANSNFEVAASIEGANFSGAQLLNTNFSNKSLLSVNFSNTDLSGVVFDGATAHPTTNFSGADLRKAEISKLASFAQADLRGVDLSWKSLKGVSLTGANLEGANLSNVSLRNHDFSGTNLNNVNLENSWLSGSDFSKSKMENTNLQYASLMKVNLSGQDLTKVKLLDNRMPDANLTGVNLQGVNLDELNLEIETANFSRANLEGAVIPKAWFTNFSEANLRNARFAKDARVDAATDFTKADLRGTNLRDVAEGLRWATLNEAILHDLDLSNLDLHDSWLIGTDLQGAQLQGANLKGARLESTKFTNTNLQGVIFDDKVSLSNTTDFSKADLRGTNLSEVPHLNLAIFTDANLADLDFSQLNLQGIRLTKSSLEGAKLEGTVLSQANLDGTNLQNANLRKADLRGSSLHLTNMAGAHLEGANLEDLDLGYVLKEGWHIDEKTNLQGATLHLEDLDWRPNELTPEDYYSF